VKFKIVFCGPDEDPATQLAAPNEPAAEPVKETGRIRYEQRGTELLRREQLQKGRVRHTALSNFTARIVRDILRDDGAEQQREFGIEAELGGERVAFVLPAAEFGRMGWVLSRLGPQAIVFPGQQQHLRAAIQYLSDAIRQEQVFTHLGWRKHAGQWVYLHAGGALGAHGALGGLQVQLPSALQHYRLHPPSNAAELRSAVRTSLQVLSAAPDRISLPLLAGVYRAALGGVPFGVFLSGPSGVFKSALAALCQQHFGTAMDASRLPANFASTANALELLAFTAKDALLVVDDFAPQGGSRDGELHSVSERLFRGVGNHQGRSRLGAGGQLRKLQMPRGLVLGTGEEVPPGRSIRARLVIVELEAGQVDRACLSRCQQAGRLGLLAAAMAGFLHWIAGQYDAVQERLQARAHQIRSHGETSAAHARTAAALGELLAGWEIFLEFAAESGAITAVERGGLQARCLRALTEVAIRQAKYQESSDPALRFLARLRTALARGEAYVTDRQGRVPPEPAAWGWQQNASKRWLPRGIRIGWLAGNDLFLDPEGSREVAERGSGAAGLEVGASTLRRSLRARGLLQSVDTARQMLTVRRTITGRSRQVLHLRANALNTVRES